MDGNSPLARAMHARGLTQRALVVLLNTHLAALADDGPPVTVRTVHRWTHGLTRWPHRRQRLGLEAVFERPVRELGFVPHVRDTTLHRPETPVDRREFLTATAVAPLSVPTARPTLGHADVDRLAAGLDHLVAADARDGGSRDLELRALARADHTLAVLDDGNTSTRVRTRMYALGAAYLSTAMWAAADDARHTDAQRHLERAAHLAGLSGDSPTQWRVWSHASVLARERGRPAEALAAAEACGRTTAARRDPLYRSLGHARAACAHAALGDHRAALRRLDHARHNLGRADPDLPRPSWVSFYDRAELAGLSGIVHLALGDPAAAEADAHHVLALLRPGLDRNRRMYTLELARAQLAQGDVEQACATAVLDTPDHRAPTGRTAELLGLFRTELVTAAPDSRHTREWSARARDTHTKE